MQYPTNLDNILTQSLDDLGLFEKARKYQLYAIWPKLVGKLSKHAHPRRIDGDVLYVATASSVWSQELSLMSRFILTQANKALGGSYFREIRFSENLWHATAGNKPVDGNQAHKIKKAFLVSKKPYNKSAAKAGQKNLASLLKSLRDTMDERKASLLAHGFIACDKCGFMYPQNKGQCPFCKAKRELRDYNCAIALLEIEPWHSVGSICRGCSIDDPWVVERVKHELESRWMSAVVSRLMQPAAKRSEETETVEYIRKLASLRSGTRMDDMKQEELQKALGKRLVSLIQKERRVSYALGMAKRRSGR